MQLDLFNKDAEKGQEKSKKLLYAYFKKMNEKEFRFKITRCKYTTAFHKNGDSEKELNEILDKYNYINKEIQSHLEDRTMKPIKGPGKTKNKQWLFFKFFCMNKLHIDNGDMQKLKYIAQENDKDCEFPF